MEMTEHLPFTLRQQQIGQVRHPMVVHSCTVTQLFVFSLLFQIRLFPLANQLPRVVDNIILCCFWQSHK